MRRRNWLALPLAAAALAAGVWLARGHYAPSPPATAAMAMWQLAFPDLQGRAQPLSQWRGRVVVLNFWASWCAPCRDEIPDFVALRAQFEPHGVEFVGIAVDTAANVRQFLQQVSVSYPILIGEGAAQELARQLGDTQGALPYTIVLDRDGKVVLSHLGRLPRATLEASLRQYGA
ncbi:TlpA family protein disulfide reductase [Thiobacillus sedimenti]|uniref:TlpA disulfide reductase family protein n=1 Tax=Thiobacillus sedimenti TaxID=3110231 RepID=A0ABZ1CJC5_9PROT|nr:TlpA disulfide reductase family protein [Thiobacillus sp. SCUT-2]WRS39495.1 TlpA disulfide reductase family protein [Thiobacillus sp. SCUT-2]